MSEDSNDSVHWSFWLIAVFCLVWNLGGVMAYMGQMDPEALAAMPESTRSMVEARPVWATAAFAIAVWGGALGCLLLLLRKSIAMYVFIASALGVLVQFTYELVMVGSTESFGPGAIVMVIMIPLIAVFLIWYTRHTTDKGWIS